MHQLRPTMPRTRLAFLVLFALLAGAPKEGRACDACSSPGAALAAPTFTCQRVSGDTDAACPSDFYAVDLLVGERYVFTLCDLTCPGAAADYDSRLRILSPACGVLVDVDDSCGVASEIVFDAPATGRYLVEVTGYTTGSVGTYTLGWRRECLEGDCFAPDAVLASPQTSCTLLADTMDCASQRTYHVDLVQGQAYTFTTCGATCPGAGASFDSYLELFDPSGALLVGSGSACGDDAEIVYTTDSTSGGGTYCLRITRMGGAGSDFQLGTSVACQAPSNVTLGPLSVGLTAQDCATDQTFTLTTAGTWGFDWTWTIAPPPGGSATPSSGVVTSASNGTQVATRLAGPGTYAVDVTVENECGRTTQRFDVIVTDRRAPDVTLVAVPAACTSGVRAVPPPSRPLDRELAAPLPLGLPHHGPALAISREAADAAAEAKSLRAVGRGLLRDGRLPDLRTPPAARAVSCATPCTFGTLEADHPFYDVFLSCDDGSFTARTGVLHSVTVSSGAPQNVIFSGASGSPGTSDIAWYLHEMALMYQDPTGVRACVFDPPDTLAEPNSIGIEAEWVVTPVPGLELTLREEIVAFGTTEADSGIRLTLGATNAATSTETQTLGVRWQIDYQNAADDGPLFATVTCDPPSIVSFLDYEHELLPTEILDFYRIQNNTDTPIFSNFTSTTELSGIPNTFVPDRLVFAYWPAAVGSDWEYLAFEGDTSVDLDSTVLYYSGYDAAAGTLLRPGDSFRRSVVIFTSADTVECGAFRPGAAGDAEVTVCEGDCAELTALAADGCGASSVYLVGASPGAPDCAGSPCTPRFDVPGDYTYEWEASDSAGNLTHATTTVHVIAAPDCPGCVASVATPPADRTTCLGGSATVDARGLSLAGCGGGVTYEWREGAALIGTGPLLDVTPPTTTTYVVSVTCADDPACALQDDVTVSVEEPPIMAAVRASEVVGCNLGIEVSWDAAVFRDPTRSGVYNVYRSETSCADALLRTPVAMGLTSLRFMDTRTTLGATYYYAVQAEDARTRTACLPAGPHHGGATAAACAAPATELPSAPLPDGVYATLFARHVGHDVTFSWPGARALLPGEHFHLLKAWSEPTSLFTTVNGEGDLARSYSENDTTSWLQFFDLRVANACEELSEDEYPPPGW